MGQGGMTSWVAGPGEVALVGRRHKGTSGTPAVGASDSGVIPGDVLARRIIHVRASPAGASAERKH